MKPPYVHQALVRTTWAVFAAMFLVSAGIDGEAAQDSHDDTSNVAGVLKAMNTERAARGLSAVSRSEALERAAQWMAEDMAAHDTLNHTDSGHRDPGTRLKAFGYESPRVLEENIAKGQETPSAVVNSWMQSPPHRANMLDPEVREAGVGHAMNARGKHYWVLDLGATFTTP